MINPTVRLTWFFIFPQLPAVFFQFSLLILISSLNISKSASCLANLLLLFSCSSFKLEMSLLSRFNSVLIRSLFSKSNVELIVLCISDISVFTSATALYNHFIVRMSFLSYWGLWKLWIFLTGVARLQPSKSDNNAHISKHDSLIPKHTNYQNTKWYIIRIMQIFKKYWVSKTKLKHTDIVDNRYL